MKKYLIFIFLGLLLIILPTHAFAQAQTSQFVISDTATSYPAAMPLPPDTPQSLLFGQKHFYTLTFRGNGEALVQLKSIFSNMQESSMSAVKLTFPQRAPSDIVVYQVIRGPQCVRYKEYSSLYSQEVEKKLIIEQEKQFPECAEYQEPDYQYGYGNTKYKKAQVQVANNTATITLPEQIKSNGSGSYFLAYRNSDLTQKDIFGAYSFLFETIKVEDSIQTLQIGVNTDSDLYLKEGKGEVNYQTKIVPAASEMMAFAPSAGVSDARFDSYYQQIGYGTSIKSASNLQPNESYSVKGDYADIKEKLYGRELSIAAGIAVVLFLFTLFVFSAIWKYLRKHVSVKKTDSQETTQKQKSDSLHILLPIGVSFGSSAMIMLYTGIVYVVSSYFGQMGSYYYHYGFAVMIIMILLVVISLSIYGVLLFIPGIIIGVKKGLVVGIITIGLTIFWLIIYGVALVLLFFFFSTRDYPQPISPMLMRMEGSSESIAK